MNRHVTIIVLCWNRWSLTEKCLATLRENTDLSEATVLVVDNGSTDETPQRLTEYGWLRTIRNAGNLGFVRGNNVGITAADPSSDILLLNNDIEVYQPDWLDRLRSTAHSAPDIGVVGCRLVLPDGRLLHAGTYILPDTIWGQYYGSLESDIGQYASVRNVEGIVFACAYIRREVIARIGGLSEAFQSYFEDTDFCLRAHEAGFRTVCDGSVTLVHKEHGSTSDTPEVFRGLFEKSRKTFGKAWKQKLEARYTRSLSWQSILNFSTGYAMSGREILRALDVAGVRMSYSYVYGNGTPFPVPEPENSGDYLLNVISGRRQSGRPDVSVVYGQGNVFSRNRGRRRIGYTMLEVDGFPAAWVSQANEMDEIWVPTTFNREGFIASGLKRPVHVMPLGVDADHFHPGIKGHPNPHGDYVFLANFEWGERKQPEALLRVFNRTFSRSEPVVLVCKVINRNGFVRIRQLVEQLCLKRSGGRIAFIFNRDLPYSQMGSLYRSADCYVAATRGEGWDMPLMEAMACGLPSIATDWGSHQDFADESISYLLKIRGTIPAVSINPNYAGFSWADPDPDHLGFLMRHVFEHREEAAAKGRLAALTVQSRWTWAQAAQRIVTRLEGI